MTRTPLDLGRERRRPVLRHPVRLTELEALDSNLAQRWGAVFVHEGPVRTCVGCRSRALATELLRLVVEDDSLVLDLRRRLPGRGAWLHPDPECLRLAERRRAFPRALRVPGPLDAVEVRDHLDQRA
ncbi:YlxR family protein [Crossiella sp. S99.1]|uniref:YlxR family protein n=1 Tax=Crossiella sp. S99.1 TaxID=2936271 RepID=UPI0027E4C59C|nr:YlxR family protein [Crossiella sp. S99.1]